jgi:predicted TIM-barrel fold metal-dependent hydrolase
LDDGLFSPYFAEDIKKALSYYPEIINKIMYGSDFCGNQTPLNNTIDYGMFVRNNFNDEETEQIFHKTAEKLYGI